MSKTLPSNPPTEIVAIDGPAGAGKTTVAKNVATRLGFAHLDTGAMYRAATWWAIRRNVPMDDLAALTWHTESMPLEMVEQAGVLRVLVDGQDITEEIRAPAVTAAIRKLDSIPGVRASLVGLQRAIGAQCPTVAEGRDIGTVVFPLAKCKIYLDASLDERTRRRAEELKAMGQKQDFSELREAIRRRDEGDTTRTLSPLRAADDAFLLDTTSLTLGEVVETIVERAKRVL